MSEQVINTKIDIPGDLDLLRPWLNVVRDARKEGISNGLSILTMVVLVDNHGMPIQWCGAEPTRLSPLSGREQFEALIKAMTGDKQISTNGKLVEGEATNGKRRNRKTAG